MDLSTVALMSSRVELAALVRPDDVSLERLHRVRIDRDRHALIRLLDTPIDHVSKRRKLVHRFLELWELMRVRIGARWAAHSARHAGRRQLYAKPLLSLLVTVEQQIAEADLLHENIVERLQLFRRVLLFVRQSLFRPDSEQHGDRQRTANNSLRLSRALYTSSPRSDLSYDSSVR